MKTRNSFKRSIRVISVVLVLLLNTGCQVPYIIESAWTHLKILSSKTDIEKALADPNLPEDWKAKLNLTLEIRPYIESLGLKITKNYQSFVDLKRPYISHLLIVAPEYSLKPKKWWFPIVGSFPYKGFHNPEKALREAEHFKKKKMDTYIRGVSAYSTLGWFTDPLLSTMMRYSDEDLVETIIHESVHATIFIKDSVDFNEQLAVFLAKKATLNYYKEKSTTLYNKIIKDQKNEDLFTEFLMICYKKIRTFYRNKKNHTPEKKAELFQHLKQDYRNEYVRVITDRRYDSFLDRDLNNAFFAANRTYHMNQMKFEKIFEEESKKDIKAFIALLKKMSSKQIKQLFEEQD